MPHIDLLDEETTQEALDSALFALTIEREERNEVDTLVEAYRTVMGDLLQG